MSSPITKVFVRYCEYFIIKITYSGINPLYRRLISKPGHLPLGVITGMLLYQFDGGGQCKRAGVEKEFDPTQLAWLVDHGASPDTKDKSGVSARGRLEEAIRLVQDRRQADGRWLLDGSHAEPLAFPFHESVGEPSRWNTLRALRVLRWYEAGRR